ncbi:ABC transporter permease subunit [sulfur-oxidizing endosymbiont of Gigantopelta aegis]|uniref:ABC transporter permease subunit n=1 Tax=sulfur-oxidizing endosymbiont of Gigantopelta aegis TaxID=2794934 RepID=UPI0018DDAFA3|nr:ABC transporter permease subunit [sulfur-oxidizing endosymbiont of Gigantopelta aegis]
MIKLIALRELKSLFLSPLAWAMLTVMQLITCYQFLSQLETYMQLQAKLSVLDNSPGITDLVIAPLLGGVAIVLLLIVPLLTMRLVSEEQKNQTLTLLFSAPISMTQIILGKYLGILGFLFILVFMIALMPLSLLLGAAIDLGQLFSALLGLLLVLSAFAAAGLYMSTLTRQPAIAAVSSFGLLLFLWIINWAGNGAEAELALAENGFNVLSWFSILGHFEPLLKGVFSSADIAYYLLFIGLFLVLAIRRLERLRLPH